MNIKMNESKSNLFDKLLSLHKNWTNRILKLE